MRKVVLFFLVLPILIFSNILGFWLDPVNVNYGFSINQKIDFWKVKALLQYDMPVFWKQGVPILNADDLQIYFELNSNTYLVEYGYFHRKVPFYPNVNPYKKGLNVVWGYTGFYKDYNYFNSEYFDMIFNEEIIGASIKYKDWRFFYEQYLDNIFGVEYNGVALYYDKYGLEFALNFKYENVGFYFSPVSRKIGFVLKDEYNFFFLNEEEVNFNMKWGEIYVTGGFQKEKRRFSIKFIIW